MKGPVENDAPSLRDSPGDEGFAGGCGYQGYEFGAGYLDSLCIDGFLWDADSCDEPGGGLTQGGDIPCPQCSATAYAAYVAERRGGDE